MIDEPPGQSPDLFPRPCIPIDIEPLIEAVATNNAVAFVGAGASVSAGLPDWHQFLVQCLARARSSAPDETRWEFAAGMLEEGDFLTAAELLQRGIGSQLEQYIWDEFGSADTPSLVHTSIARIPFSMAITTNYDRLLENAYASCPPVRTWLDAPAVFSALRNNRPCIVKTHGDVGNRPSLVLTKTEFRDIVQKSAAFNSCLRMLLTLRTFLFVGYSLRDHDLLALMDEARVMYDQDFGPHYAILFEDKVDEGFLEFLRDSYAIHTIVCPREAIKGDSTLDHRTDAVVRVLREISGRVGERQLIRSNPGRRQTSSTFNFREEASRQLRLALKLTGSFRGEVSLISDEHFQFMERIAMEPPSSNAGSDSGLKSIYAPQIGDKIEHHSVVGRLFLMWRGQNDFVHISDVRKAKDQLTAQGLEGATYKSCHPDVLSEIACPIIADGHRVGVLNVESESKEAYTRNHMTILQNIAARIGNSYLQMKHLKVAADQLAHYHGKEGFSEFNKVMHASRLLHHHNLQYILYKIDYEHGQLIANYDKERLKKRRSIPAELRAIIDSGFSWAFRSKSLAAKAFRNRQRILITDVTREFPEHEECDEASLGLKAFGIDGALVCMPVTVKGHVAAILVGWPEKPTQIEQYKFKAIAERVHRMAHLIADDPEMGNKPAADTPSPSKRLCQFLEAGFDELDSGEIWSRQLLDTPEFRAKIVSVALSSLVQEYTKLARVRLWMRDPRAAKNSRFKLVASLSRDGVDQNVTINDFVGAEGKGSDPYVQYTLTRFKNDPYARHQHKSMFDKEDVNHKKLQKADNGTWIVGPIVNEKPNAENSVLMGYISADSHLPDPDKPGKTYEPITSDEYKAFQRRAIDLVTDILKQIVFWELNNQKNVSPSENGYSLPIEFWPEEDIPKS